jgi:hypothetical protein
MRPFGTHYATIHHHNTQNNRVSDYKNLCWFKTHLLNNCNQNKFIMAKQIMRQRMPELVQLEEVKK